MNAPTTRTIDVGTIRQTEITMPNGDIFLVDTCNMPDMVAESPLGFFVTMADEMFGASTKPFETMIATPNGEWASFSKANFNTEKEALSCHDCYVQMIIDGRWQECEGNDKAIIDMFDERKNEEEE